MALTPRDSSWELVDPIVANPVVHANEKRNYIYIYIHTETLYQIHKGRGQDFPIFISCRYLVELDPPTTGSSGFRSRRWGKSSLQRMLLYTSVLVQLVSAHAANKTVIGKLLPCTCNCHVLQVVRLIAALPCHTVPRDVPAFSGVH